MPTIEIMRTGRFTAMSGMPVEFSQSDLHMAAAAYSPQRRRAVLTIGHPEDDRPDLGEVAKLTAVGDRLFSHLPNVSEGACDLVRRGLYKHVSASFFTPTSPNNPTPGAWYLRHVGMLGAMPPAVKGLASLSFAAMDSGVLCFADADAELNGSGVLDRLIADGTRFAIPPGYVVTTEQVARYRMVCEFSEASGLGLVEAALLIEQRQ